MRTFQEALARCAELADKATLIVQEALGQQASVLLEWCGDSLRFQAQVTATASSKNKSVQIWVTQHSGVLTHAALDDVLGSDLEQLGRTDVGVQSYREETFSILDELLELDKSMAELSIPMDKNHRQALVPKAGALYFERDTYSGGLLFFQNSSVSHPRAWHPGWREEVWDKRAELKEQAWSHYQARVAPSVDNTSSNFDSDVPMYLQEYAELPVSGQVEHISWTHSAGGNSKRNPSVFQPISTIE
jgi:hypothetical protein